MHGYKKTYPIFGPMLRTLLATIFFTACLFARVSAQSKLVLGSSPKQLEAESAFIDAEKAEMLENPEEAIRLFQKSLNLDPENAAACYKLAGLFFRQNRWEDARHFAKKATQIDDKNRFYFERYAEILEAGTEPLDAIPVYRKILKKFPNETGTYLTVAQIYIRNRKYSQAIKELDKAQVALGPSNELFQIRQKLWLQQGKKDEAIRESYRWVETIPNEPESHFGLCQLLVSLERWEEALTNLQKMGELFPGHPSVPLMKADVYIQLRKENLAEQEMKKAFANPDLPVEAKIDIVSGFLRGMETQEEKSKAILLCNLIVQTHPADAKAYLIRGDIYNRMEERHLARQDYLKARSWDRNNFGLWEQVLLIDLKLNEMDSLVKHTAEAKVLFPNTPSFAFYNGMGNLMMKRYPEAIESLEHARRISLENKDMQLEIYSQLGDAYYNQKDKEKAFENFDEALRLDSANLHVLNNYSYFLSLEKTNMVKALKMSRKLIQLQPDDPTFLDTHGWVLYQSGNHGEAVHFLEKATKNSKSGTIWEHYGDALFQIGRKEDAFEAWKKAENFGGDVSTELARKLREKKLF